MSRPRIQSPRSTGWRLSWAAVVGIQVLVMALFAGATTAQEIPGLRDEADRRLDGPTVQRLAKERPGSDEWSVEEGHARLSGPRAGLLGWIADPSADAQALEPLIHPQLRFQLPELELVEEGEAPLGWRIGRARYPVQEGRPASFSEALRGLFPGGAVIELATSKVAGDLESRLVTEASLHAASVEAGAWEFTGVWKAIWNKDEEEPERLRLRALVVENPKIVYGDGPRFVDRTKEVLGATRAWRTELAYGISFWRQRLEHRLGLPILGHPAGIALGDVDGDGLEDLFLCQPGGLANRLFLHRADGAVVDISSRAGVDHLDFSRAAMLLDLDRDGDRDLALVLGSELALFSNRLQEEGVVRFEPETQLEVPGATMLAAADHDGDGDLDLYVCSYFIPYDGGAFPVPYHDARNGSPNRFFVNDGGWSFRDATEALGFGQNNDRFSFAASWEDYDNDGDPDLYVANDFGRNNLYRNEGGRFVDVAAEAGVEDLAAGMGVSWGDFDGDGWMDLHVSNMYSSAGKRVSGQEAFHDEASSGDRTGLRRHAQGNTLFRNAGDGTFQDVTAGAGVSMGRWAWGSVFLDFENDSKLDLFVPNGFLTAERDDDL